MKNVFFALALMLTGTVSFGTNANSVANSGCSDWSTFISCGVTWHSCNSNYDSIEDQWEFVEYIHELHCGD